MQMQQQRLAVRSAQETTIRNMLRDEEGFLRRAGPRELTQAVLYFRTKAAKATTPQMRDFYLDRAHQFSLRAINNGIYGLRHVS